MRLSIQKSKNHEFLYIVKDFYSKGKRTTKIIDKLGTVSSLMLQLNLSHDEVISWARQKAKDLTLDETHESNKIILSFSSNSLLPFNDNRAYNCGYLFLQSLLYQMKISNIFRNVLPDINANLILKLFLLTLFTPGSYILPVNVPLLNFLKPYSNPLNIN